MTNKTLYLEDPKRLEKVQPIMERRGIEADAEVYLTIDGSTHVVEIGSKAFGLALCQYKTYRADKLEMALPEWVKPNGEIPALSKLLSDNAFDDLYRLIKTIGRSRGKEKLEALTDLLILLEENNLCQ